MASKREKELLKALYLKEERSIREIADLVGWKKDKVHFWLKRYGIKRNKRMRKGKLYYVSHDYLKREFEIKAKAQVARELGVSRTALYKRMKKIGY